ncbi:TonB-dependent receptor family protein [Sabulicella glaciei]|uniref:TonB-dependent receptor n=1 Tax=Sabulicella glaciei TaxID=2984948 RepID=A0ABT3NYB5_9PROT|nr:TonB-dependent receptor [Roseococcus sp. MDT2-1-1]MCW8087121.1 TonB-dependent receptor [Roseococcus sp. MDT2-1-1]
MPPLRAALPLLLLAAPAAAQHQLPETVVTGTAPRLTVPTNEEAEIRLRLSPGANTMVPASEFQERPGTTTLRDMTEWVPGVFAQPKWGEDSRLSIRGSGLARNFHLRGVRLLQDGVPVNQADGSGDFAELDPLTFQRVEVLRGGNAFALGANTLGGAINFVTPTGRDMPGGLLRFEGGSFGMLRGQVAHGASSGPVDAWVSGTMRREDGFRQHSKGDSGRMNANVAYRWSENAETRVFLAYNAIAQRIPGAVTRSEALQAPRRANATNIALDYQRNIESYRLGTRTAVRVAPGTVLEFGGSWVTRQLDHPIFQYVDNRTNDLNAFGRVTWDGTLGGFRNRLVAGVNFAAGTNDNRRFVNLAGVRGAQTFSSRDRAQTLDAYAENSFYILPRVALVAGISGGQAVRQSDNRLNPALGGSLRTGFVNPRAGLLWQATDTVQLFGNLTWATEPPTLSDLVALVPLGGFSLLKDQRAMTLEAGARGTAGPLDFEATFYRAWIRKEIQLFQGPAPGSAFAQNADRTIHQGVELAGRWTVARGVAAAGDAVSLRAAYALGDFHFDGDRRFGDNQLPGAPRHLLRAELRYRHGSGAWIAPNLEYVPEGFFVDNANTTRTNSYALVGLRAGAEFLDGRLSAFLEARNLADRRTISSASVTTRVTGNPALYEPGMGRAAYAGLRLRF